MKKTPPSKVPLGTPSDRDVQSSGTPTVTATQAQNQFGRVLDDATRVGAVVITKHGQPKAVLLSITRFGQLREREARALETLSTKFDEMLDRMQTPESGAAVDRTFEASPQELGRAAVAGAARSRRE